MENKSSIQRFHEFGINDGTIAVVGLLDVEAFSQVGEIVAGQPLFVAICSEAYDWT